jgi:hypothetical protein
MLSFFAFFFVKAGLRVVVFESCESERCSNNPCGFGVTESFALLSAQHLLFGVFWARTSSGVYSVRGRSFLVAVVLFQFPRTVFGVEKVLLLDFLSGGR